MSIQILPGDVLLEIFDLLVDQDRSKPEGIQTWQTLVHVCQQWRAVVLGSPRRLNLRLSCSTKTKTPVRDMLDTWPPLPLIVYGDADGREELDNTIAVLERSDRVCEINIRASSCLETVWTAMQKPFPELTLLSLISSKAATVIPDSFLGGSAPRLRTIRLIGTPFRGLLNLVLSATHLDTLQLSNLPQSVYPSLDAILTVLSTLTSLRLLVLEFPFPRSLPTRRPPPLKRLVLPALFVLRFKGICEYLEDLVAHIDAPGIDLLDITLFNQIVFDAPQTIQTINRTPSLKALEKARLTFQNDCAVIGLSPLSPGPEIEVRISCRESDWQLSSMEQVCTSCLPFLYALRDLYIDETPRPQQVIWKDNIDETPALQPIIWKDNIDNMLWLELLQPFAAVKNLYLSETFALRISPALQELVGDRTTEVLPTLRTILVEELKPLGPDQEGIVKFVAARELTDHPVFLCEWDRDYENYYAYVVDNQ